MVGTMFSFCWRNVGSWLTEYCFMVGGLILGQRLSNDQTYVGPTKCVAVGPTLNQRLGFGWRWRMVSVLAGAIVRSKLSALDYGMLYLLQLSASCLFRCLSRHSKRTF